MVARFPTAPPMDGNRKCNVSVYKNRQNPVAKHTAPLLFHHKLFDRSYRTVKEFDRNDSKIYSISKEQNTYSFETHYFTQTGNFCDFCAQNFSLPQIFDSQSVSLIKI